MTYARRKLTTGVEPAHLNAPPRLRQSHVERPFVPWQPQPGLFARLFGRRP